MTDFKPPVYVARNRVTGDLLIENDYPVQGTHAWVAEALKGLVSEANREAFEIKRKEDIVLKGINDFWGTKLTLAGQMRQSELTLPTRDRPVRPDPVPTEPPRPGIDVPNEPRQSSTSGILLDPIEEEGSAVVDTDEGPVVASNDFLGLTSNPTRDALLDNIERVLPGIEDVLLKYAAVLETLDRIGAPLFDKKARALNANGRLEDWLEMHGYHPDVSGSARARRDDDANAFRFTARIRAALDDYEGGTMSYDQLVEYIRRTSTSFDS